MNYFFIQQLVQRDFSMYYGSDYLESNPNTEVTNMLTVLWLVTDRCYMTLQLNVLLKVITYGCSLTSIFTF